MTWWIVWLIVWIILGIPSIMLAVRIEVSRPKEIRIILVIKWLAFFLAGLIFGAPCTLIIFLAELRDRWDKVTGREYQ